MSENPLLSVSASLKVYKANAEYESHLINQAQSVHRTSSTVVYLQILQSFILVCLIPIIAVNNLLIITATWLFKRLKNPDNMILSSLALADLMVGLIVVPLTVYAKLPFLQDHILSSQSFCLSWLALAHVITKASLFNLFLLSIERFVAINWPLRYPMFMSQQRTLILIAWTWMLALILFLLPFILMSKYDPDIADLEVRCSMSQVVPEWYVVSIPTLVVIVPLGVSGVLYLQVFFVVVKQLSIRRMLYLAHHRKTISSTRTHRKQTRTILCTAALMMLFIVLWLPTTVISSPLFKTYHSLSPSTLKVLQLFAQLLLFSNSIANTMVYGWCKAEYKKAISLILTENPTEWAGLIFQNVETEATLTAVRYSLDRKPSGFYHFDLGMAMQLENVAAPPQEELLYSNKPPSTDALISLARRYTGNVHSFVANYLIHQPTPQPRKTRAKSTVL